MEGEVHSIETFGTVDGPGIRYVIFTQGCPLRCAYCHNPDTWISGQGNMISVDWLVDDIAKYTRYIEGVTVSGGEPLIQIDFLTELFIKVKELGLSTCIDTSGINFDKNKPESCKKIDKLLEYTDLVLLDIKHINDEKCKKLTTQSNNNVLEFAKYLNLKEKEIWIRYVLVPTINDDEGDLLSLKQFINSLDNVTKIEVLPYHTLGVEKYRKLGIPYRLEGVPEPTSKQLDFVKNILEIDKGE